MHATLELSERARHMVSVNQIAGFERFTFAASALAGPGEDLT